MTEKDGRGKGRVPRKGIIPITSTTLRKEIYVPKWMDDKKRNRRKSTPGESVGNNPPPNDGDQDKIHDGSSI